jgi:hypothetical protein
VCGYRYATKADVPAEVVLDVGNAERLGFSGSEEMLQLLSSMVLAKPVSPCEAATILSGEKIVDSTASVVHIPSFPPSQRSLRVGPARSVVLAKVRWRRVAHLFGAPVYICH